MTEMAPAPFEGEVQVQLFQNQHIRQVFHEGEWYFAVADVIEVITQTGRPAKYWSDLKRKLAEEGFDQLSEKIGQLKMPGPDGKYYLVDSANTETMFRIIQSIRSPRAEPLKRWLAKVGFERILETHNPEIAVKRAIVTYQLQGYDNDWINARIKTIVSRKELTSEWSRRGVKPGLEFAVLTNVISTETFGVNTQEHKNYKNLKKSHELRDHMTELELILTMLGEKSTTEIARQRDAQGFRPNEAAAHDGGQIAGTARRNLEQQLGRPVVTPTNFLHRGEGQQERLS